MQVTDCIVEAGGSGKTTVPTGQYLSTKFNACIVEAGGSAKLRYQLLNICPQSDQSLVRTPQQLHIR